MGAYALCLCSCISHSAVDLPDPDIALLPRETVLGNPFRHVIVRGLATGGTRLHVYLEGDGVPYSSQGRVTEDPTSRSGLMLKLMAADPAPSIYIGRPCYMGLHEDSACNSHCWTDCRFSPSVIGSMRKVLIDEILKEGASNVVLIGHSGGGTIAMLLAHDVTQVSAVVTLGGNLDIDAWARLHHYAPLACSLNPTLRGPLPARVTAIHLVGAEDRVTPPEFVRRAAELSGGRVQTIPRFTHTCCWRQAWPALLQLAIQPDGAPAADAGTNKNSPLRWPASASTEYRGL
jgi:hypothetical protein